MKLKLKNLLLVICAFASIATAHAHADDCNRGHKDCTMVHDTNTDNGGGVQILSGPQGGSGEVTVSDPDKGQGGDQGNTKVSDPDKGQGGQGAGSAQTGNSQGETEAERLARTQREADEQRQRLEEAKRAANDKGLTEAARRAAAQEALRAQGRFRYELNAGLSRVKAAAISTSNKLRKELETLKIWQKEMVKAGLTKDLAIWYEQNHESINTLVAANGDGQLTWLSQHKAEIEALANAKDEIVRSASDHSVVANRYADRTDKQGISYKGRPLQAIADDNADQDSAIKKLWNSVGAEWWVKLLAIIGPILAVLSFLLRKK